MSHRKTSGQKNVADKVEPLKLLISIVEKGKAEELTNLLEGEGFTYHFVCIGKGTASSDILDYLGLGETEKEVIFSTIPAAREEFALNLLENKMELKRRGKGIAFTVSLTAVGGATMLRYLSGSLGEEVENERKKRL